MDISATIDEKGNRPDYRPDEVKLFRKVHARWNLLGKEELPETWEKPRLWTPVSRHDRDFSGMFILMGNEFYSQD
jgi:hypothetical protein